MDYKSDSRAKFVEEEIDRMKGELEKHFGGRAEMLGDMYRNRMKVVFKGES